MPARMKKRHIDNALIRIVFIGPQDGEDALIKAANDIGFSESIPWKEAFPEFSGEELPGVILSGARNKEGLTQKELAARIGINQGYLSDMERGKRSIGRKMAQRIAAILNVNYKIFL